MLREIQKKTNNFIIYSFIVEYLIEANLSMKQGVMGRASIEAIILFQYKPSVSNQVYVII